MKKTIANLVFFLGITYCQTEVVILSNNVGTEIDLDENRFYKIFPDDKKLKSAQIIKISKNEYKIIIVNEIKKETTTVDRIMSSEDFQKLREMVNSKPLFKEKDRIAMYEGLDFLRAEKIINDIPKPQYVILKHSGGKKLKGTLTKVEDNFLFVQTSTMLESIHLENIDRLSYKNKIKDFENLRPYVYVTTGISGYLFAQLYNNQRPTLLNEYGIARKDLTRYRQIFGIVIGLIFSSEVFDAIATLLTPTDTIILSEAEYDNKKLK